jgi:uncharacterized protein
MSELPMLLPASNSFSEAVNVPCKVSRFNARAAAPDGSLVVYNTRSGKICIFPPRVAAAVEKCLSHTGIQNGRSSLGAFLAQRGFLVPENTDEVLEWDRTSSRAHSRTDSLDLVLFPTEDCNFRCVYCYGKFPAGVMAPSIRAGIRKTVEARLDRLTRLHIGWFGGEPLLGWEVIEELGPFFAERAAAAGIAFSAHITTNGYLLTPDVSRKMLDWRILDYQVTLDGPPETHDQSRPLRDGGPTFERILGNLAAMAQYGDSFSVRLRVNFDQQNVALLEPLMVLIRERLRGDPRFQIAFQAVGKWGGPNDDALRVIAKPQVAAHQRVLRGQARSACVPYESATRLASPASICYAANPTSFRVGVDGRVMKCGNLAPSALDVVGRVTESNGLELDEARHRAWAYPYYQDDAECRECFYLPVCQGGIRCPIARIQGKRPPCPPERARIQALLLEYWEEKRAQGAIAPAEGTESA